MKKHKCGCVTRKILKSEIKDYPKGTMVIADELCKKHEKEYQRELKKYENN